MVDIKTQFDPVLRNLIKNKKQIDYPNGSIETSMVHTYQFQLIQI